MSLKNPGELLVTRRLGQDSLIPAKYRRLVRTVDTNQAVATDYTFPDGLTGDEAMIELAQRTINEMRIRIIEEVIEAAEDPLTGQRLDEWGIYTIYEQVVADGTAADVGYYVRDSTVTPLGNGKSIKITVTGPPDLLDVRLINKSLGQVNLIPEKYRRLVRTVETNQLVPANYAFPLALTGNQSFVEQAQRTLNEIRVKILEEVINTNESALLGRETDHFGNLTITEEVVVDGTALLTGYDVKHCQVTPLGNGKSIRITVNHVNLENAILRSFPFDPQMLVSYEVQETLVPNIAILGVAVTGEREELKATDYWHKLRTLTIKSPLYTSVETALISYHYMPYTFPGRIDISLLDIAGSSIGYKKPHADLVQTTIRTWWETGAVTPTADVDEIFTNTILINGVTYENVLHNATTRTYGYVELTIPPTIPSYSEYIVGGTNIPVTGILTFTEGSATVTGSGTAFLTELEVGDELAPGFPDLAIATIINDTTLTLVGLWPAPTASGTASFQRPPFIPWLGSERVIAATIKPAREHNTWKVETQSVIMR